MSSTPPSEAELAKCREVFGLEVDAWCYGITQYPGDIFPELVHRVVREMRFVFSLAIQYQVAFDLLDVAAKITKAAKYLINEKEVVFSILAQLPSPASLKDEEQLYTLAAILDRVEQVHGGALERLERKWSGEARKAA